MLIGKDIIHIFWKIYIILLIIFIVFAVIKERIMGSERKQEREESGKIKCTWSEKIKKVYSRLTITIIYIIILFVTYKFKTIWAAFPLIIFSITEFLVKVLEHMESFSKIIFSKEKYSLTLKELCAVLCISLIWWYMELCNVSNVMIQEFSNISNKIISDLLIMVAYVFIVFMYIFVFSALTLIAISEGYKLYNKKNRQSKIRISIKKCTNYFVDKLDQEIVKEILLIDWINNILDIKVLSKKIVFIGGIPFIIIIDIFKCIYTHLLNFFIWIVAYMILLFRIIISNFKNIFKLISNFSDREVVIIAFRIAIILALVIAVIGNRYDSFFILKDESTAILEFVSSAIIIPIIFEWINSYFGTKKELQTKDKK